MAKVIFNQSLKGVSGKVGRWVFREQHGQTVVVPLEPRRDKPTKAQRDHRARFLAAQSYASAVLADPLKRECYRRLGLARRCPPNALLVANFLNAPTIEEVDLSAYRGRTGDPIRVVATDSIEVVRVTVIVRGAEGATLEEGVASKDHDLWVYRCSATHAGHGTVAIEVSAENRAGTRGTRVF